MSPLALYIFLIIVLDGINANLIRLLGKNEPRPALPSFLFQFLGAILFVFFIPSVPPLSKIWIYPLLASLFYGIGGILMFKAFEKGEVSLLSPLGHLTPIILLPLSYILLNEPITLIKVLGIGLIIYGSSYLKKQKSMLLSLKALLTDKSCQAYFGFLVFFAVAKIIDKKATAFFPAMTYVFLQFFLPSMVGLVYIVLNKELKYLVSFAKRKYRLAGMTGLVVGVKYAVFYLAIARAEVSRVMPLNALSTLVAFAIAVIIFKEKVQHRWIGALFMVAGAILLAYKI